MYKGFGSGKIEAKLWQDKGHAVNRLWESKGFGSKNKTT